MLEFELMGDTKAIQRLINALRMRNFTVKIEPEKSALLSFFVTGEMETMQKAKCFIDGFCVGADLSVEFNNADL